MAMRIAITGGIACGKTAFSKCLAAFGVELLDADDVVHWLEAPGGEAVATLRRCFGDAIIDQHGGVDRTKLGELVFNSHEVRARVNALLHPMVRKIMIEWVDAARGRLRVAVIPLLFEAGWESDWDFIVCLSTTPDTQLQRLTQLRGLTLAQAEKRVSAQMPVAEKARRSNLIVHNDADVDALAREAHKVWRILLEKSDEHGK